MYRCMYPSDGKYLSYLVSVSQCYVPISAFLLGVKKGAGCALMVHTPAASGIKGGDLAKWSCLSCEKQRGGNNNKVFLALKEKSRGKSAEKDLQGEYMHHKGVYFRSLVSSDYLQTWKEKKKGKKLTYNDNNNNESNC